MKSKFQSWFEEQFGSRPVTESKERELISRLRELESEINAIKNILSDKNRWDAEYRAARYAYNFAKKEAAE